MTKRTIEKNVLIGSNEQLFLYGGTHSPLARALNGELPSLAAIKNFSSNIQTRALAARGIGADYLHVVFPDKHSALPEAAGLGQNHESLASQLLAAVDDEVRQSVLHPLSELKRLSEPYIRTDTHISADGAVCVALEIVKHLRRDEAYQLDLFADCRGPECRVVGDLGNKLTPRQHCTTRHFKATWNIEHHTNNIDGGNDGNIEILLGSSPSAKGRALLIGDSFLHYCLEPLSYFFEEILFLRSRFLHSELLTLYRPDVLVTANVERYLASIATDNAAPIFLLYPQLKNALCHPTPEFATTLNAMLTRRRAALIPDSGKSQE